MATEDERWGPTLSLAERDRRWRGIRALMSARALDAILVGSFQGRERLESYLIDDFFDSITLYDNRALSATAKALPDGRYEVTLDVFARKVKADELGKESEAPLDDWIDIGVLDGNNEPLFLEKRKIDREKTTFTIVVAKKPARAGIDPYNKLIDRRPRDNTVAVSE